MTERLDEFIPVALDGERVDRVVALLADLSRSAVARLIDAGSVRLDQTVVTVASRRVAQGSHIEVDLPARQDSAPGPDSSVEFLVRHEDTELLVIDKPAGLVVHPGAGHDAGTLVNGLVARYPELCGVGEAHRPGIVHRLDRGTSGLLVVARTKRAYQTLVAQFAAHEPERIYRSLVWGHPEADQGTIDAPIGRSPRHPTRMTVTDQGRAAVTHYVVDRRFFLPRPTSLLTCRLETGRTHQIRVHLKAIGHAVVGDRDYDGSRPGLDPGRPFLHAGALRLRHPETGDRLVVESPLPEDLVETLARCS